MSIYVSPHENSDNILIVSGCGINWISCFLLQSAQPTEVWTLVLRGLLLLLGDDAFYLAIAYSAIKQSSFQTQFQNTFLCHVYRSNKYACGYDRIKILSWRKCHFDGVSMMKICTVNECICTCKGGGPKENFNY